MAAAWRARSRARFIMAMSVGVACDERAERAGAPAACGVEGTPRRRASQDGRLVGSTRGLEVVEGSRPRWGEGVTAPHHLCRLRAGGGSPGRLRSGGRRAGPG